MVALRAGDTWAKLVLEAGRVCLVEDSVKAGGKGTPEGELTVPASVDTFGKDPRLGDFGSVMAFSWYGSLWFLGSAV